MSRSLAAVITAMESGADRAKSIAAATGMKVESAHARLHELKQLGVVQSYAMRTDGRRGLMPKFYRIAAGTTG